MKKKGLLISTIVMVVVLIAALTTSTYAWFQTSSVTSIEGFNVSVETDNAVNIGFKRTYASTINGSGKNDVASSMFVSQNVTYTAKSSGATMADPGTWNGVSGLYSTLQHNIKWNSQRKAVGVTTAESISDTSVTNSNTGLWKDKYGQENAKVIAANGTDTALSNVTEAKANINGENDGDYVHFILGVSPARDLERNSLIIMVNPTSDSLGVLASIHVAYRVTKASDAKLGDWQEVDLYNGKDSSGKDDIHWNTELDKVPNNLTANALATYKNTYNNQDPATGAYALEISGLDTEAGKISQIELVIYMAGSDTDNNNNGLMASGEIKLFFDTANEMTASNGSSKLTINTYDLNYDQSSIARVYASSDGTTLGSEISGSWITDTTSGGKWESSNAVTADYVIVKDGDKVIKVFKFK